MRAVDTDDHILAQMDVARRKHRFIFLDGGKEIPVDVRMTIYRDVGRWAMVMEELMFFPPSPGHWGIADSLAYIGNCITPGDRNLDNVQVTSDGPDDPTFLDAIGFDVNPDVRSIRIRGQVVPVDLSSENLRHRGIPVGADGLRGKHLVWSLVPEYRHLLLATEEEKRRRLPADIPKFMQLDEWNHPALIQDQLNPSNSETFVMLAKAIATGDPAQYRPTLPPNTHWRNWLGYPRV